MGNWERRAGRRGTAAVAETPDPSRSGEAIRCAVELAGGLDWLERGQTVLVKPALNSSGAFPFTASPASCAEIVKMCLERGAGKVYVADEMGFEHTMLKHWKTGKFAGFEKDQTIKAFKKTGIHEAVSRVAEELGAGDRVHVTTFREHGWRRHEFTGPVGLDGATTSTLSRDWLRRQLRPAEKLSGEEVRRRYIPRLFDKGRKQTVPGLFVPVLCDEADHIVNVFRISAHVWSHFTMAIKNWVGIMRPDDRVWMHQLNYLKNHRHERHALARNHPIRSEPLYNEQLADLHLPHAEKEKLCVADATEIILSGGPDATDRPLCRANLVLAADDIVAADVVSLAILRWGTLKAPDGLLGKAGPQPSGWAEALRDAVKDLKWPEAKGKRLFRGTDSKLCDPTFSNWDWASVQRAYELGLGPDDPERLQLVFDEGDSPFAVSSDKRSWITEDSLRPPLRAHRAA